MRDEDVREHIRTANYDVGYIIKTVKDTIGKTKYKYNIVITDLFDTIYTLNEKRKCDKCFINKIKHENKQQKEKIDKAIDFITEWEKETKEKRSLEVSMLDLLYIKDILGDKENE